MEQQVPDLWRVRHCWNILRDSGVLGHFTSETAAATIIAGRVKCWGVLLVREQPLLLLDDSMLGRLIAGGVNAGAGVFYCWRSQMLGRFNIKETTATIIARGGITAQ